MNGVGQILPTRAQDLRVKYACPRCRSAIELIHPCAACGFEAKLISGVVSFVTNAQSNDVWQRVFDELAAGTEGDTVTAVDYRSSLQHRYIIAAFRDLCGKIPSDAQILEVGCGNG